jgi:hypothetical protein
MSPALRSDGKGHLSRRITLMVLPFEHVSEPDATGDFSNEIDGRLHLNIGLETHPPRVANTPVAEIPYDSPSSKKSSSCS